MTRELAPSAAARGVRGITYHNYRHVLSTLDQYANVAVHVKEDATPIVPSFHELLPFQLISDCTKGGKTSKGRRSGA